MSQATQRIAKAGGRMADDLDFSKLTKAEVDSMNFHAFYGYAGGSRGSTKTCDALAKKGFLTPVERQSRDRIGIFRWVEYHMPIHIHLAWCLEGEES